MQNGPIFELFSASPGSNMKCRWMGSRVQSTVIGFPEMCFLQFSQVQVLVGVTKAIYKQLCLCTWARAGGFNNNNNLGKIIFIGIIRKDIYPSYFYFYNY